MYKYEDQKQKLFTDDGQRLFLLVRDKANKKLDTSGAALMGSLIREFSGDSWTLLACIDRMAEIGELIEIPNPTSKMGQDRIFIKNNAI